MENENRATILKRARNGAPSRTHRSCRGSRREAGAGRCGSNTRRPDRNVFRDSRRATSSRSAPAPARAGRLTSCPPFLSSPGSPWIISICAEPGFFAIRHSSVAPASCTPPCPSAPEEVIEENLRLALLIALQGSGERDELREGRLEFSRCHLGLESARPIPRRQARASAVIFPISRAGGRSAESRFTGSTRLI